MTVTVQNTLYCDENDDVFYNHFRDVLTQHDWRKYITGYTVRQKTAPYYFRNNFVKSFHFATIISMHIPIYILNKMTSKSSIFFEGCLCTPWNAANVHVLWLTSVLSRNLKRDHYRLQHLNEKSSQCNSKTYDQMSQLFTTGPNLCPQPKSSLINRLINDNLLDAWSKVASTHQHLAKDLIDPLL